MSERPADSPLVHPDVLALAARVEVVAPRRLCEASVVDDAALLVAYYRALMARVIGRDPIRGRPAKLTRTRLMAIRRLIVEEQYAADDLAWAMRAYQRYVLASDWHRQDYRHRLQTIDRWLASDRLEQWVEEGGELRLELAGTAEHRQRRRNRRDQAVTAARQAEQLMAEFCAMAEGEQERLVARAVNHLTALGRDRGRIDATGGPTMANPLVRSAVLAEIQRRRQQRTPHVSEALAGGDR